jgi:hypothetical protein
MNHPKPTATATMGQPPAGPTEAQLHAAFEHFTAQGFVSHDELLRLAKTLPANQFTIPRMVVTVRANGSLEMELPSNGSDGPREEFATLADFAYWWKAETNRQIQSILRDLVHTKTANALIQMGVGKPKGGL